MEERQAVSRLEMEAYFGPGGRLSECLPGFEHRREQVELAREVMRALARGDAGLFEAGTGTGKSLAYLIPAALSESRTPVVISTYTISSRNSCSNMDIPIVQKIPELRAVLVKGWRTCVLPPAGRSEVRASSIRARRGVRAAAWAQAKIEPSPTSRRPSADVWDGRAADSRPRSRRPTWSAALFATGRRWPAHLAVVNHHLLMSDVAVRKELTAG